MFFGPACFVMLSFLWYFFLRQQWISSPPETTREIEDYQVELSDVTVLELVIVPDKSHGEAARASLKSLRLA